MNESTAEVMSKLDQRVISYDRNGATINQRRAYHVDADGKKHQIKNMDAWHMIEDSLDSYANLNTPAEPTEAPELVLSFPGLETAVEEVEATPAPTDADDEATVTSIRTSSPRRERFLKTRRGKIMAGIGAAAAAALIAFGPVRGGGDVDLPRFETTAAHAGTGEDTTTTERQTTTTEATTSTTEAPTTTTTAPNRGGGLTQEELEARYGAYTSPEQTANELGFIEINQNDADKSLDNLYNELRHNRKALAFWVACLGSETPGYAACVEDPAIDARAESLMALYADMELGHVATVAEGVIAQFENAEFGGISIESGTYKTVAVGADGSFIPATNNRTNDPRLNFVFEFNGNKYSVQIRSCVQITENEVPTPPVIVTPPKEEVPETPPTTVPEQPTTTTTVPEEETTTTTESTTTTTEEETTTTTEEETTTTTEEETTTTQVTVPKTDPTYPEGEVTTTVGSGDPTPQEPTTSTVPQSSTSSTRPADSTTSTTAPEIPTEPDPGNPNWDVVLAPPLAGAALLKWLRSRRGAWEALKQQHNSQDY